MMFTGAKSLLELLADENPVDEPVLREEPAAHGDSHDPRILQLRLKRKYQMGMIRKMLEEGGYKDLAKIASISKRDYDEDVD